MQTLKIININNFKCPSQTIKSSVKVIKIYTIRNSYLLKQLKEITKKVSKFDYWIYSNIFKIKSFTLQLKTTNLVKISKTSIKSSNQSIEIILLI